MFCLIYFPYAASSEAVREDVERDLPFRVRSDDPSWGGCSCDDLKLSKLSGLWSSKETEYREQKTESRSIALPERRIAIHYQGIVGSLGVYQRNICEFDVSRNFLESELVR